MNNSKPRRFVRMFKPQFAEMVADGRKTQTIRPVPARMPEAGDTISLRAWEGKPYRSKQRVLREAEINAVLPITIREDAILISGITFANPTDQFAQDDGFADWDEMRGWFEETHGLPFSGVLISWEKLTPREVRWSEAPCTA